MDPYLTTPKTEKDSSEETCDRLSYGVSSMQGWRKNQEDAYNCIINYDTNTSYFAIYDGHRGPEISNYCAENLPDFIKNSELYQNGDIENALITSFLDFDKTLTQPEVIEKLETLRKMNAEPKFDKENEHLVSMFESVLKVEENETYDYHDSVCFKTGSTAIVAILKGNELFVANAGDSRCILCRNGTAVPLSYDHTPRELTEFDRIIKAGGYVTIKYRIDNRLNVSRTIGDHIFKLNKDLSNIEQKIIPLPDIQKTIINPEEDEFMILSCDGIFEVLTNETAVEFVKPRLKNNIPLSKILEEMLDACLSPKVKKMGSDNMSAILITFKPSPP